MAKKTSKTGKVSTLKIAKSPSKTGSKRTSVKTGKMTVVPKEEVNWFAQAFLFLLNIVIQCVRIPYILLMKFPSQPAYLLGILRLIFWGYIIYYLNSDITTHDGLFHPYDSLPNNALYYGNSFSNFFGVASSLDGANAHNTGGTSWLANLFVMIAILGSVVMFIFSFLVSIGINKNTTPGSSRSYSNIETTMDILDSQLSSYENRKNFINNFINKK